MKLLKWKIFSNIEIYEKSYKNILIYYIGYVACNCGVKS